MTDTPDPLVSAPLVLAATDGSHQATEALRRGLAVVRPPGRLVVVTVIPPPDMSLVVGTGTAAGVVSMDEKRRMVDEQHARAEEMLRAVVDELGLAHAETLVLDGDPGREICLAAADQDAAVVVLGTRGRGGVKRFVLGSVSDHVVRNAPCPVVTVG